MSRETILRAVWGTVVAVPLGLALWHGGPAPGAPDLAPGTALAQLGAYATAAEAETAWQELFLLAGDLLAPLQKAVVPATSGGEPFVRLRVHGFGGIEEARDFCAGMIAVELPCIPLVHRG